VVDSSVGIRGSERRAPTGAGPLACPRRRTVRGRRDIPCRFVSSGGRGFGVARPPGVFVRTWLHEFERARRAPDRPRPQRGPRPGAHGRPLPQPRGDAPRRLRRRPPIADVWSRTHPWRRRGAFPPPIIVRRASTRSTSFVLAALRALHVDRAFTAGALGSAIGEMPRCAGMPRLSWATPGWDSATGVGNTRSSRGVRGEPDEPTPPFWDHNPRCGQPGRGSANSARDPTREGGNPLPLGQGRPERAPRLGPHGRFVSGGSDV